VKSLSVFNQIYNVVQKIPKGKVATYGTVARMAGNPRWSRVVGYALHVNPAPGIIPCHRVVNREGKTAATFAFGGGDIQRQMLEQEGVVFESDGHIDLSQYGWK
jgi:methylated-DNA-protein-cysteine methyltransferase-like protein